MTEVHDPPKKGQGSDPSAEPLHWNDAEQVRAWFVALREVILDGFAAGHDATRPPKKRFFSRREARHRLREAERSALGLLDAGQRGLDDKGAAP